MQKSTQKEFTVTSTRQKHLRNIWQKSMIQNIRKMLESQTKITSTPPTLNSSTALQSWGDFLDWRGGQCKKQAISSQTKSKLLNY